MHKLQDIKEDFHMFAKSGINEQELLMGPLIIIYLLKQKMLVFVLVFLNMITLLFFLLVYTCQTISIVTNMSTMRS